MKVVITQPGLVILICDCNELCGGVFEQKILGTVSCGVKHLKLGAYPIKSLLSLVQEMEDDCPIRVRPHNHGTSWDSGQVAGPPLCHIGCVAVAAQKLEVLGAKLLGP